MLFVYIEQEMLHFCNILLSVLSLLGMVSSPSSTPKFYEPLKV